MLENIRLSIQGIFAHKIRSILTMLGIIIGIAAIIAIVSTIREQTSKSKAIWSVLEIVPLPFPSIKANMSWICSIKDFRPVFR